MRAELRALGAEVSEDDAAARIGAGCGNIVGRFAADRRPAGRRSSSAPTSTRCPVTGPIEVELVDGHLTNRHAAILGGDDKCAVAVMIEAMRRVRDEGLPHAGVELLFTPCEEIGLRGAAAFDPAALRGAARRSSTTTPGRSATSSPRRPSLHKIEATFIGRAAHAGIAPEAGRSAIDAAARAIGRMPLGRIDPETTANVGTIEGGTATNVVAERCEITAEARSRDERALAVQLTAMLDALTWAASECEVDLETRVDREFTSYRLAEDDPQVRMAVDVLTSLGHRPLLVASGGGSDVNALHPQRLPGGQPLQRDDRHPHARRADRPREPRGDVRRHPRPDRRRPRARDAARGRASGRRSRRRPIYEGTIVNLRRSDYRRPDGTVVTREVMDHPGAVVMVPVEDDHVLLVRQPREAVEEYTLELPAGQARPPGRGPARAAPGASWRRRSAAPRRAGATSAASTPPRRSSPSSSTASWRRA